MATATDRSRTPDVTRFEAGAMLVAVGAVVLLISLFFDWYEPGRSAWQAFEVWDLVLAALALTAMWAAGRVWSTRRLPERWLFGPGIAALVIVVESLLNHPPAAIGSGPMVGIWLALGASLTMVIGAGMSIGRVSVAIQISDGPAPARDGPGTWSRTLPSRFRHRSRVSDPAPAPGGNADPATPAGRAATPGRSSSPDEQPTEDTRVLGEDRGAASPPA